MNRQRLQPGRFRAALIASLLALLGGWWLVFQFHLWIGQLLSLAGGGVAIWLVFQTIQQRIKSPENRQPAQFLRRLTVFGTILMALAGLGIGTWLAYSRAYNLVHPKPVPVETRPEAVGIDTYQDVHFTSPDGLTLRGWYVPTKNGAVVIFVHGLGSNREALLWDAALAVERGYGALLLDLRNSGESEGDTTTLGFNEAGDVKAAVDFVIAQPEVDGSRIALFGHSMGGAAVLLAGASHPNVRAVVAQSTYTSIEDNIKESIQALTGLPAFPFAPLVVYFGEQMSGLDFRQVRPIDAIAALSPRPVLVVHGTEDGLISVENAYRLYAAAGEPKELYIIEGADHGGLPQKDPEEYQRRIFGFLDRYLLGPAD